MDDINTNSHNALDEQRFKGVYEKIDSNHIIVNNKIDSNHKEILLRLDRILEQTTKTNGRVSKLEDETQFLRTVSRYPKLAVLAIVGSISLIIFLGLGTIFKIF